MAVSHPGRAVAIPRGIEEGTVGRDSFPRPLAAIVALALGVSLIGCGGSGPATGQVSGMVTFEGKAVSDARITFHSKSGHADEAELSKDGSYSMPRPLPVGEYQITVIPSIVRKQVGGKGPVVGEEREAPDIPQKYRTIGSTDLKATVKEGKNENVNFDMKRS